MAVKPVLGDWEIQEGKLNLLDVCRTKILTHGHMTGQVLLLACSSIPAEASTPMISTRRRFAPKARTSARVEAPDPDTVVVYGKAPRACFCRSLPTAGI